MAWCDSAAPDILREAFYQSMIAENGDDEVILHYVYL